MPEETTTAADEAPPETPEQAEEPEAPKPKAQRRPTCPDCRGQLHVYEPGNPHKDGQGHCERCGERKPLG